jgi:hypothetical protein
MDEISAGRSHDSQCPLTLNVLRERYEEHENSVPCPAGRLASADDITSVLRGFRRKVSRHCSTPFVRMARDESGLYEVDKGLAVVRVSARSVPRR